MRITKFNIRREGGSITGGCDTLLTVPSVEMTDGKLFNSDEDRLYVLSLLLESVGVDAAIRLAPRELWRQALDELE